MVIRKEEKSKMYSIFRKENVFTCVMFGAILIFVIIKTIFNSGDLWGIAYLLAFPILILSILKLFITMLEDANFRETEWLDQTEKFDMNNNYEDIFAIRQCNKVEINSIISTLEVQDITKINSYKNCYELRKTARRLRRILLFLYYFVFMIIFVLLLLHTELTIYLKKISIMINFDTNALTMWSFIIILIEIMMKNIFENIIFDIIYRKYKVDLQNYWY